MDGFKNEELYESVIYKKDLYEARKRILDDKVKIKRLVGNNGVIRDREYMDKLFL